MTYVEVCYSLAVWCCVTFSPWHHSQRAEVLGQEGKGGRGDPRGGRGPSWESGLFIIRLMEALGFLCMYRFMSR